MDQSDVQNYLSSKNLKPRDYLGQNFLVDEIALEQIVDAAELKADDVVLEVGPGLGVLTKELSKRVKKVIAVEKDQNLAGLLSRNSRKDYEAKNVTVFTEDILRFNLSEQIQGPYKVVANIPYYLTSKLFQYFLEQENKPELLVLMVQKEVGERVVAAPGDLSILGISIQIFADAKIVAFVPKESFWPVPKVDSVILKITPKDKYPEITDQKLFFRIVKMGFAGKRKQIHNTLVNGLKLPKEKVLELLQRSGIEPTIRPQDISIESWIKLYKVISNI